MKPFVGVLIPWPCSAQTATRHLEHHLPAPQRPTYLEVIDRLPRLPNGKLDRNSLRRSLDPENPCARPQAATSPIEVELLDLFQEVLGPTARGQGPGRTDNFFSLGGHSLTSVRLLARLRASTASSLPSPFSSKPPPSRLWQSVSNETSTSATSATAGT